MHGGAGVEPRVGVVAWRSGSTGILLTEGVWKPWSLRLLVPRPRDFCWLSLMRVVILKSVSVTCSVRLDNCSCLGVSGERKGSLGA